MKNGKVEIAEVLKKNMEIQIGFPECVRIELVQVNELRHYEIFTGFGSLFSTAAAGFWVSYATATSGGIVLLGVSIVFTAFTLVFGGLAFYYRRKLNGSKITKTIPVESLN